MRGRVRAEDRDIRGGSMSALASDRRRTLRPFGLALFTTCGLMIAGVLAIAFFGSREAGEPSAQFALGPNDHGTAPVATPLPNGRAARYVNNNLVSDLALIEETTEGSLPRIADDGRTPMTAYAASFTATDKRPRIAIVIGGIGMSESLTSLALAKLPPGITLSVVPFAANVQTVVDGARGQGHEVLLEVPMEPLDYPESDPGPNALMVAANAGDNTKRLNLTLGKATGYVGITGLLGGRFLGEMPALQPVLETVSHRGLMFFDNGSFANSVALTASRHAGTPFALGSIRLDPVQTPDAIDNQLAELQMLAIQNGSAIGAAAIAPVTIERVAVWAEQLDSRGYVLVPLTQLAAKPTPAH